MKHFTLLVFFLSFLTKQSFAQDLIIKSNSDTIQAKIIEITPNEIKYKKYDFQDGPLYVENKANVVSVIFSNGMREIFPIQKNTTSKISDSDSITTNSLENNKIQMIGNQFVFKGNKLNEKEIRKVLLQRKDSKMIQLIDESKQFQQMQYIGFTTLPLVTSAAYFFAEYSSSYNNSILSKSEPDNAKLILGGICLLGAIVCPIASYKFQKQRKLKNRAAIKLYNEKF